MVQALASPRPIFIGEHEVKFNGDGSLQVGCTIVTSGQFEAVAARRAKAIL